MNTWKYDSDVDYYESLAINKHDQDYVALVTVDNQIKISNRFPALNQEAILKCNELIKQANQ